MIILFICGWNIIPPWQVFAYCNRTTLPIDQSDIDWAVSKLESVK